MNNQAFEVNFEGIVGPTHNYGGLSYGNVASQTFKHQVSNPREAALQGLEKMKFLSDLGIKQAVLPPHERPHLPTLHALGFRGSDAAMVAAAFKENKEILASVSSSAAMWTANAATVSPSQDNDDLHMHISVANLSTMFHRSIEASTTETVLRKIFHDQHYFIVHSPLPEGTVFADEGAANHFRMCKRLNAPGVQVFVFGKYALQPNRFIPKKYPARQTYEACRALARRHQILPKRLLFVQQHPDAIDAGAFHNDVVAVSNENLLFFHEQAFANKELFLEDLHTTLEEQCDTSPYLIEVKSKSVSLADAVSTYLFNSQLLTLPDGMTTLLAPTECQMHEGVHRYLEALVADPDCPIRSLHYTNLRQSMENGGGPACLRLRVILTERELAALHQKILFTQDLYERLKEWILKHYRDKLHPNDLADPKLLTEEQSALDELTRILSLGPIYSFQKKPTD